MNRLGVRVAQALSISAAGLTIGGCGAYLHRPSLEASTAKLKTDVAALPVPALLADQQKKLADFAGEEDRSLVGFLTASRDLSVLNVLHPAAASGIEPPPNTSSPERACQQKANTYERSPAERLHVTISKEICRLSGYEVFTKDQSHYVQTQREVALTSEVVAPFFKTQLDDRVKRYHDNGGKLPTDCNSVLRNRSSASLEGGIAWRNYAQIASVCAAIAADHQRSAPCDLGLAGQLADVCDSIPQASSTDLQAKQRELEKAIAALRALADVSAPDPATAPIRALLEQAEAAFGDVGNLSENEKYANVLSALNQAFNLELTSTLQTIGDLPKNKRVTAAKASVLAALHAIDAVDRLTTPAGNPLDEPSALLIGVAKTQHDLNIVRIELDQERQIAGLKAREATAIRNALYYSARAQEILCPGYYPCRARSGDLSDPAIAEALGYYLNGVNEGVIPYRVLQFREIQVGRASAVSMAQAADADYRALIQPAIDQLAAYGKGGITPEQLAPLINAVPISGAILVK